MVTSEDFRATKISVTWTSFAILHLGATMNSRRKSRNITPPIKSLADRVLRNSAITFVGILISSNLWAAPVESSPDDHEPKIEQADSETARKLETSDISIPREKPGQIYDSNYFYKYDRTFSPHLGYQKRLSEPTENVIFGFHYMFGSLDPATHWELTLQLLTGGFGQFFATYKNIINPTKRMRPFWRIGPGGKVVPDQFLATFFYSRNWLILAGGGFEYVMKDPMSLRLDFNVQSSLEMAISYSALVGWSWGF
jgi:hypothetical protein